MSVCWEWPFHSGAPLLYYLSSQPQLREPGNILKKYFFLILVDENTHGQAPGLVPKCLTMSGIHCSRHFANTNPQLLQSTYVRLKNDLKSLP